MDIEIDLDPCGGSSNTSNSEEKYLDESIYLSKNLISTLKDVKDLSKENLKQEKQLKLYELENEKLRKTIINLNAQREEVSRLSGMLTNQLNDREAYYERQQSEVASLRQDIERTNKKLS